jgi:hypothetical protein
MKPKRCKTRQHYSGMLRFVERERVNLDFGNWVEMLTECNRNIAFN